MQAVRAAHAAGRRIRVVGAGHSFSAVAAPDEIAMSLDDYRDALHVDRSAGEVTAPAGMRLRDLSAALARAGLSLPIVGSIQAQSIAGAIATGTHGSSLRHGNLATLVRRMRLVTGNGEVVEVARGDELMHATAVHLGALGVVTSVTLPVQPAGRLRQTFEHIPVDALPDALPDIAASAEYVKVWWLSYAPTAQVIRYERTTDPMTRRPSPPTQRWIDDNVMHRFLFPALLRAAGARPTTTARVNKRLSTIYLGAPTQVGPDVLMLNTPNPMRHRETEAALPLSATPEAVKQVLDMFDAEQPSANFPIEIRFVRGDDNWLSPAYGADTCQIGAYTTDGPRCAAYFDAFWRVMRAHGARPHWGKELDHDAAELAGLYPEFASFAAARDELDPDRVFGGEFHDRVLGA